MKILLFFLMLFCLNSHAEWKESSESITEWNRSGIKMHTGVLIYYTAGDVGYSNHNPPISTIGLVCEFYPMRNIMDLKFIMSWDKPVYNYKKQKVKAKFINSLGRSITLHGENINEYAAVFPTNRKFATNFINNNMIFIFNNTQYIFETSGFDKKHQIFKCGD